MDVKTHHDMTKQKILFVNACIRKNSRTRFLAEQVIRQLNGTVVEAKNLADRVVLSCKAFKAITQR